MSNCCISCTADPRMNRCDHGCLFDGQYNPLDDPDVPNCQEGYYRWAADGMYDFICPARARLVFMSMQYTQQVIYEREQAERDRQEAIAAELYWNEDMPF